MARLSTHVLDTSRGVPAQDLRIEVHRLEGSARQAVADARTNAQGRTDAPLLSGDQLVPGLYELTFHVGDYFRGADTAGDLPFLDTVPVRIGLSDAGGDYHVPLLLSPYGYTTYRGT